LKILWLAIFAVGAASGQTPDIDEIMRRVALNQAKSQDLRTSFVYHQRQLLRMIRSNKKVAREEHREYTVAPQFRGVERELVNFDGRYDLKGQYLTYDKPGFRYKGVDLDGDLLDSLADDMTHDKGAKDGISNDLFPLTFHRQLKYSFTLVKTVEFHGSKAYHVRFEPKQKPKVGDIEGGAVWKGEAWIDADEYQPIQVATSLAWKMPFVVRTMLGTDFHGVGFTVTYQKFADGLWFPVTYGGEFDIKGLFFYRRTMTINMVNSDFRRTDVKSDIAYATEGK
jgi:hypothetical protein